MSIDRLSPQSTVLTQGESYYSTQLNHDLVNKNGSQVNSNENKEEKNLLSKEKLNEVVESMNQFLQPTHTSLKFELHEKLDEYYVKIIDDETKEVIREIPSKKILDMYAAMTEFMGLVVDKKI